MLDEFPIPQPFGPLNTRDDQYILGKVMPSALVSILNMEHYEGGLRTRSGYTAYNGTALTSGKAVMALYAYKKSDGTKQLIATCGTNVYKETSQGVFVSIKSGVADSNQWDFLTLADMLIGVDGVSLDALKYDGTTVYPYAITPPPSGPTAALISGGNLTGQYSYKVTFVSKWGAETNAGNASSAVTANNHSVALSNIPLGGADVAKRNIYRTLAGGSIYFILATIADNTTPTFNDNVADTALGTDIVPIDHDPPPSDIFMIIEWKRYIWAVSSGKPTRMYFSHQGYPEIYNTDELLGYYVDIGMNDGETIIGMRKLAGNLYAFKENSTWPITGDTPDDFKVAPEPINGAIGLYHRSIDKMPDGRLIGLHRSGVYYFDGYRYNSITDRPDDSIQSVIDNLNPNRLNYAKGYVDIQSKRYLLCVSESGYSYNNKMLVYDFLRDRWTIFDIKGNDIVRWNDTLTLASSQSDGKIYLMGGTNDNGMAINVYAEWPWWSLWDTNVEKTIRFMLIDTTQAGTYEPTLTAYIDGRSTAIPVYREDRALWGSGRWVLDGGKYRIKKLLRIDRKGIMSLKIRFSHAGLNEPITLAGMTIYGYASDRIAVR